MNRHVGASFTLSVLVVVFFAVILNQPDRETPPVKPPGSLASGPVTPAPVAPGHRPEPTPTTPAPEPPPEPERANLAVLEPGAPAPAPSPLETSVRREPKASIPPAAPARVRAVSRTRAASAPRSAFTLVGDDESLDDVALRVYGTTEKSQWLWMANRDLIDRKDASLRAGTLLRTP